MGTLVLIDQADSSSRMAKSYLLPYLDHFGIVYEIEDIHTKKLSNRSEDYSLIIIGHDIKNPEAASKLISQIQLSGAGIVSFDPDWHSEKTESDRAKGKGQKITFNTKHYITALHESTDTIKCTDSLPFRKVPPGNMKPIVFIDGQPLLLVSTEGSQPIVTYTSMEWMKLTYLGPMMGLDDCLWRSLVWAARKPFVMRGLPPLVTMRVDDVAGRGELTGQSPLGWVKIANKYGFKPWLGLFIYNLSPITVDELRGYLLSNQATASPHAFGRPNRDQPKSLFMKTLLKFQRIYYSRILPFIGQYSYNLGIISVYKLIEFLPINQVASSSYALNTAYWYQNKNNRLEPNKESQTIQSESKYYYCPEALPLRSNYYDEFIFFDHQTRKPWSNYEAKRGLEAMDKWYSQNQPLPMSKYFIPHWYEFGSNVIPHLAKKWGIEFIGMNKAVNTPYTDSTISINGAPFRLFENTPPVTDSTKTVYYADFVNINGIKLFNSLTEIRDDHGYEWSPDNNTESSAARGIRQLKRALSSMALASLFTHETDFIYKIKPKNWEEQIKLISKGIHDFNPMMLSIDEALKIVRAHKTSKLISTDFNKKNNQINIIIDGITDVKSYAYLFITENGDIKQNLIEIPVLKGLKMVSVLSNISSGVISKTY
jgi:hypothetical protein